MIALLASLALAAEPAGKETTEATPRSAPPPVGARLDVTLQTDHRPPPRVADFAGAFAAAPHEQWSARLPGGRLNASTHTERTHPVIVPQGILVGSAGGKALYLLSRLDGELLETYPADGSVESGAVVDGDLVYFSDTAGTTWCYQLTGMLVWRHPTGAPILADPTLANGKLYVSNVDDLAMALDARSGDLVWQYHRKKDPTREAELTLFASPRAAVVGRDVVLGFSDGSVVGVDAETGDERWSRRIGEGRYPDIVAGAAPGGTDIYVSGYYKPFVAIDQASHNVRWRQEYGGASSDAVLDRGGVTMVYHPDTNGKLHAVVGLTGAEKWTWDSDTEGALTTPVATPAGLLIGSSEGGLWLVDPDTGDVVWTWHGHFLLEGVTSEPAVDGRQMVFVTNAGRIYGMLAPETASAARTRKSERHDAPTATSTP